MGLAKRVSKNKKCDTFFVSDSIHPQTGHTPFFLDMGRIAIVDHKVIFCSDLLEWLGLLRHDALASLAGFSERINFCFDVCGFVCSLSHASVSRHGFPIVAYLDITRQLDVFGVVAFRVVNCPCLVIVHEGAPDWPHGSSCCAGWFRCWLATP